MSEDLELEEIRRRKLEEYRKRLEESYDEERKRREFELKKEEILRKILTPEARNRINTVKLVKPELINQLELQLMQLALAGKIKEPLTDEQIKELLRSIQTTRELRFKIYKKE
ncbi:MAG: DNA-binding protein [Thermoproteota archaeon]|jgi:programmed cell death protein 5|nr:DNA-binding protein [Thermoproteota archaeon]